MTAWLPSYTLTKKDLRSKMSLFLPLPVRTSYIAVCEESILGLSRGQRESNNGPKDILGSRLFCAHGGKKPNVHGQEEREDDEEGDQRSWK